MKLLAKATIWSKEMSLTENENQNSRIRGRFNFNLCMALFVFLLGNLNTSWAQTPQHGTVVAGNFSGIASVSASGQSTYHIPIEIPPGINGMQPTISLNYSSATGLAEAGHGWSLSTGQQIIHLCRKTHAQDGISQATNESAEPVYCLNGNRMIKVSNTGGVSGNPEYRTEIATQQRISHHHSDPTPYFRVENPDGTLSTLGHPLKTIDGTVWGYSTVNVFDDVGNRYQYRYQDDPVTKETVLSSITYTHRSMQGPRYTVQFKHQPIIGETSTHYKYGNKVTRGKRLYEIQVVNNDTSETFRRYHLDYEGAAAGNNNRNRLEYITHCSLNGATTECMRPIFVQWFSNSTGWAQSVPLSSISSNRFMIGDWDGDGTDDLFAANSNQEWEIYQGKNNWGGTPETTGLTADENSRLMDANGDGKADILQGVSTLYLSTPEGPNAYSGSYNTGITQGSGYNPPIIVDYDGDGLEDIIRGRGSLKLYKNTGVFSGSGNVFAPAVTQLTMQLYDELVSQTQSAELRLDAICCAVNVNDDGIPDFRVRVEWTIDAPCGHDSCEESYSYHSAYIVSNGSGYDYHEIGWDMPESEHGLVGPIPDFIHVDVNGDGITDRLTPYQPSNPLELYIGSNGGGFSGPNGVSLPDIDGGIGRAQVADINTDGKPDIYWRSGNGNLKYRLSIGEGFGDDFEAGQIGSNVVRADINGDGYPDLVEGLTGALEITPTLLPDPCSQQILECTQDLNYGDIPPPSGTLSFRLFNTGSGDVVQRITDSYGNYSRFSYETLSALANQQTPAYTHDFSTDADKTLKPLWSGLTVVTQMHRNDGLFDSMGDQGEIFHSYTYKNALMDTQGRGFLGFSQMTTTDSRDGIVTERIYEQKFPKTGLLAEENVYQPGSSNLIRKTVNNWTPATLDQLGAANDDPSRIHVYLDDSTATTYNVINSAQGTAGSKVSEIFRDYFIENEEYGQADKVVTTVRGYDAAVVEVLTSTLTEDYSPVVRAASDPWCLTLSSKIKLTATEDGDTSDREHMFSNDLSKCRVDDATQFSNSTNNKEKSFLSFGYDSNGNLNSVSHSAVGSGTFKNGEAFATRRIATKYEAAGYYPDYRINCFNDGAAACTETDTDNPHTEFEFDHNLGSIARSSIIAKNAAMGTNPSYSMIYDGFGRITNIVYPGDSNDDEVYNYLDCSAAGATCWTDHGVMQATMSTASGSMRNVEYDALGRMVGVEESTIVENAPSTTTRTSYEHDEFGRVSKRSNPFHSTASLTYNTSITYDLIGRVDTITAPSEEAGLNRITKFIYDRLTVTREDAEGRYTKRVFDALGRLIESYEEGLDSTALADKISYAYDEWSNLTSTTNSTDGSVIEYDHDIRGRVDYVDDPDRGVSNYEYDPSGAIVWMDDAKGQQREYRYDNLGRLVEREDIENGQTDGVISYFQYYNDKSVNGFGNLQFYRQGPAGGHQVDYTYDEIGRVLTETTTIPTYPGYEPVSAPFVTSYSYTDYGQLHRITYPDTFGANSGLVVEYGYSKSILETVTRVGGSAEVFYTLNEADPWGNAEKVTFGNQVINSRVHNMKDPFLDSITSTNSSGDVLKDFTFKWDKVGNLTQRDKTTNSTTVLEDFVYDTKYRLDTATVSNCGLQTCASLDVNYDANGNVTGKSDVGMFYEYNSSDKPHAVRAIWTDGSMSTQVASMQYDANGNMTSRTSNSPNAISTIHSMLWTTFDKPSYIDTDNGVSLMFYDANYRRYRQIEQQDSTPGGQPVTGESETLYVNELFERHVSYLDNSTANPVPIIGYRQYVFANGQRIAVVTDIESTGSGDGDPIPDAIDNCSLVNNPTQLDTNGDGFGNNCDPDVNDDGIVNFSDLSEWQPSFNSAVGDPNYDQEYDFDGNGVINFIDYDIMTDYYLIGPGPAGGIELGEKIQYLHTDHLGSVDAISDEAGELIGEYSYDAFGKQRNPYTWGFNPNEDSEHQAGSITWTASTRGYTDHEQLRAVGLVHMNGRVYDPQLGRMTSADPLIPSPSRAQSFNRYSYVQNNPLSRTDPTGYMDINGDNNSNQPSPIPVDHLYPSDVLPIENFNDFTDHRTGLDFADEYDRAYESIEYQQFLSTGDDADQDLLTSSLSGLTIGSNNSKSSAYSGGNTPVSSVATNQQRFVFESNKLGQFPANIRRGFEDIVRRLDGLLDWESEERIYVYVNSQYLDENKLKHADAITFRGKKSKKLQIVLRDIRPKTSKFRALVAEELFHAMERMSGVIHGSMTRRQRWDAEIRALKFVIEHKELLDLNSAKPYEEKIDGYRRCIAGKKDPLCDLR